jgi:hypothetical protein
VVESGGADYGVDPGFYAGADVLGRRVGRGEVDDDVRVAENITQLDTERWVGPPAQLQVFRALDRVTRGRAHPACGAGDYDLHASTLVSGRSGTGPGSIAWRSMNCFRISARSNPN